MNLPAEWQEEGLIPSYNGSEEALLAARLWPRTLVDRWTHLGILGIHFGAAYPGKGPSEAALLTTKCFKEATIHLFLIQGGQLATLFPDSHWLVLASISLHYFIIQQIFAEQYLSDRTTLGLRVLNRLFQIYLCATVLCFHSLSLPPFPLPKVPGIIFIILSNTYLLKKKIQ